MFYHIMSKSTTQKTFMLSQNTSQFSRKHLEQRISCLPRCDFSSIVLTLQGHAETFRNNHVLIETDFFKLQFSQID